MSNHKITALLIDDRVEVSTPSTHFAVSRRDVAQRVDSCPIDYLAGALGS